jgi:4-diphosphocytidyl-2-C-methyl-D-erythritol kinase
VTSLREIAPAKINVCLFVGPRRDSDGRHELVTVFQGVNLFDRLTLQAADNGRDEVVCPGVDGDNLALLAIATFRARTGWDGPPVRVQIEKRIPIAGGMAGGSADAAATLRLLATHSAVGSAVDLLAVATELGADVPAQLRPGRHLGTGAGEVLEPLPGIAPYRLVVVPSPHQLSTAAVFARARELGSTRDGDGLRRALEQLRAMLPSVGDQLIVNDLQAAAIDLCPWIDEARGQLLDAGADHAIVSGSGPTVIGFFSDPRLVVEAAEASGGLACRTLPAQGVEPVRQNETDR